MIVGICQVELYLPGTTSLKDKRSRLKPLLSRVQRQFNISAAEVDYNDVWQSAMIGLAMVSNEHGLAHAAMEQAVHWIERNCPDVQVVDWMIEVL